MVSPKSARVIHVADALIRGGFALMTTTDGVEMSGFVSCDN